MAELVWLAGRVGCAAADSARGRERAAERRAASEPVGQRSSHLQDNDCVGARQGIELHLIEPRKPNQNAYGEGVNGWRRDDCMIEQWFTSLDYAKRAIETLRREQNEK